MRIFVSIICALLAIGCLYLAGYLMGPAPHTWYNGVHFILTLIFLIAFVVGAIWGIVDKLG